MIRKGKIGVIIVKYNVCALIQKCWGGGYFSMFEPVNKKLERAGYCLANLKTLALDAGGFAHIPSDKQQAMRANLDCFFFEIISAKDFFLQGINDHYGLGLQKQEATNIAQLKTCINCKSELKALDVVVSIEKELSDRNSWLWQLNNYRNSATHRELLHMGYEASTEYKDVKTFLFKDPEDSSQGNTDVEIMPYCEQSLERMRAWLEGLYSQLGIV